MGRAFVCGGMLIAAFVPAATGRSAALVSIRADVAEWSVIPSSGVVSAGDVQIRVRNLGVRTHQLMIVRTRRFADALRLQGDQAVAAPVAAPIMLEPGQTGSLTVRLRSGSYVLLDNLPWHYWKGTSVAISVR